MKLEFTAENISLDEAIVQITKLQIEIHTSRNFLPVYTRKKNTKTGEIEQIQTHYEVKTQVLIKKQGGSKILVDLDFFNQILQPFLKYKYEEKAGKEVVKTTEQINKELVEDYISRVLKLAEDKYSPEETQEVFDEKKGKFIKKKVKSKLIKKGKGWTKNNFKIISL